MILLLLLTAVLLLAQFPEPATPQTPAPPSPSPSPSPPTTPAEPPATAVVNTVVVYEIPVWVWLVLGVMSFVFFLVGFFTARQLLLARLDPFVRPFLESRTVAIAISGASVKSYAVDEKTQYISMDDRRGAVFIKIPGATGFKTDGGRTVYFAVGVGQYAVPVKTSAADVVVGLHVSERCRGVDTVECAKLLAKELAVVGTDDVTRSVHAGNIEIFIKVPRSAIAHIFMEKIYEHMLTALGGVEMMTRGIANMETKLLDYFSKMLGGFVKSQGRALWIMVIVIIVLVILGMLSVALR